MPKITVNEDICKGCGLCTANCPKKIIRLAKDRLNDKGYHPAECFEPEGLHRLRHVRHHVPRRAPSR